jgi:hypothetical protein
MRKQVSFYLISLIFTLFSCSQSGIHGNRELATAAYVFDEFDSMEIDDVFLVSLYQSEDYYVEIEAEENLMDHINLHIDGTTLKLNFKEKILPNIPIKVNIATPELMRIDIRGVSRLRTVMPFVTPSMTIHAQGASYLNMDLVADEIWSYSKGAAKIELSGSTNLLVKEMEGAGVFNGLNLGANKAKVNLNGVGKISVNALESLDASVDGLGKVEYAGSPEGLDKRITGMGKIVAVGS